MITERFSRKREDHLTYSSYLIKAVKQVHADNKKGLIRQDTAEYVEARLMEEVKRHNASWVDEY